MSDLLQSLKSEITRLSRKEIKAAITPLQNSNAKLKKTVADLKAKIDFAEARNRHLLASIKNVQVSKVETSAEEPARLRITPKVIRNLRSKLGLTRESFAKLLGVSSQTVYALETKEGKIKLRTATLSKFLAIKNIGKREALRRLAELDDK